MTGKSSIEWTDATWNPIVGCSIVSPGCTNCYAMKMAARIEAMNAAVIDYSRVAGQYEGTTKRVKGNAVWTGKLAQAPEGVLLAPLKRKKPTTYFVNSMGDLFHEDCPDEWIDKVFAVMALSPQHTFQVLTKRAARMLRYIDGALGRVIAATNGDWPGWPLPNVWLGVSTERQQEADERIPLLLQTPAAVRFISAEPLLGPINLEKIVDGGSWGSVLESAEIHGGTGQCVGMAPALDWVIVGGESGRGARPFHVEWADEIVKQCREASVPCFVKQLGSVPLSDGYALNLKSSKGADPAEWPDRLVVREMPHAA